MFGIAKGCNEMQSYSRLVKKIATCNLSALAKWQINSCSSNVSPKFETHCTKGPFTHPLNKEKNLLVYEYSFVVLVPRGARPASPGPPASHAPIDRPGHVTAIVTLTC